MRHVQPGKEAVSFATQPFAHQALIMLGGILFNLIFALFVLMFIGFTLPDPRPLSDQNSTGHRSNIMGPVGIIRLAAQSVEYGINYFIYFLAILSINLAIVNLLPLPILDGGQLLILMFEKIGGAPIPDPLYQFIMTATIFLMIYIVIFATRKDLARS